MQSHGELSGVPRTAHHLEPGRTARAYGRKWRDRRARSHVARTVLTTDELCDRRRRGIPRLVVGGDRSGRRWLRAGADRERLHQRGGAAEPALLEPPREEGGRRRGGTDRTGGRRVERCVQGFVVVRAERRRRR